MRHRLFTLRMRVTSTDEDDSRTEREGVHGVRFRNWPAARPSPSPMRLIEPGCIQPVRPVRPVQPWRPAQSAVTPSAAGKTYTLHWRIQDPMLALAVNAADADAHCNVRRGDQMSTWRAPVQIAPRVINAFNGAPQLGRQQTSLPSWLFELNFWLWDASGRRTCMRLSLGVGVAL